MTTTYNKKEASDLTGLTSAALQKMAFQGKLTMTDDGYSAVEIDAIVRERAEYISFCEYASGKSSEIFHGEIASDRRKLLSHLEVNDFFGLSVKSYNELLWGTPRDELLFLRSDIPVLDERLQDFFGYRILSEDEKLSKLFDEKKDHPESVRMLQRYIDLFDVKITPSFTEAVRIILSLSDLLEIDNAGYEYAFSMTSVDSVRQNLSYLFNYFRTTAPVKYSSFVEIVKRDPAAEPAYNKETWLSIGRCIFDPKYIEEHGMIDKALKTHTYAELWLYLALFFACGWRAQDVCRGWKYPELYRKPDLFPEIDRNSLEEDLLHDRLPVSVYDRICDYCVESIVVAEQPAHKTRSEIPLDVVIENSLRPFFGLLTLIGEVHMAKNGDGKMQENRTTTYQNKVALEEFFGPEMTEILRDENIHARRLNKSFLQATEDAARRNGASGLVAGLVASMYRNHMSRETISHYVGDHHFNEEDAATVLFGMLERKVFGFVYYQTLCTAFPDAFRNLPFKVQTELISVINDSALLAEEAQSGEVTALEVKKDFEDGDTESVVRLLEAMYFISLGRGKGKDIGVYCMNRATFRSCDHPAYESCLENCCPHLVLTKYGVRPLLEIIKKYADRAANGDKKAEAVLLKKMKPRYREVFSELAKRTGMSDSEMAGIRTMTKEALYGTAGKD